MSCSRAAQSSWAAVGEAGAPSRACVGRAPGPVPVVTRGGADPFVPAGSLGAQPPAGTTAAPIARRINRAGTPGPLLARPAIVLAPARHDHRAAFHLAVVGRHGVAPPGELYLGADLRVVPDDPLRVGHRRGA